MDLTVNELMEMQRALQEKYRGIWEPIGPEVAANKLLWGIGEIGEVIDILKKRGPDQVMADPEVRRHFIEETADVFMYLADVMLCFGIDPEEFARIYREKHEYNMVRRFAGTKYEE